MSKRAKSELWKFYEELPDTKKMKCTLCSSDISRGGVGKTGSTSALKNHLLRKHPNEYQEINAASTSSSTSSEKRVESLPQRKQLTLIETVDKMKKWDIKDKRAQEIHRLIGEMIVLDNMPFSMVENSGFRRLMQKLASNYNIPSRNFFSTNIIPKMYDNCVNKIKELITGVHSISLTSDIWTCSHSNESFISLTAHWVSEDYEYKHVVLHCKHFPGAHTGDNIKEIFLEMLGMWGIDLPTVHVVVRDNGKNIVKGCKEANMPSVSCFIHTLQLVVNDGIATQRAVTDLIAVSRKIVGHFNHSPAACAKLKDIQKELGVDIKKLIQDVTTRWNSTFYMLERLVEQKRVINLFLSENEVGTITTLTSNQWNLITTLLNLLRPFEEITRQMSSDTAHLSQVIPLLKTLEKFLEQQGEQFFGVNTIRESFLSELKRRFGDNEKDEFYVMATILDPRYKLAFFSAVFPRGQWEEKIKVKFYELFPEHVTVENDNQIGGEPAPIEQPTKSPNFWECFNEILTTSTTISTLSTSNITDEPGTSGSDSQSEYVSVVINELRVYLSIPLVDRTHNPITWWKENKINFPLLSKLAKKYLSAPATSVYSERLFSEAGNIYEETRSRLLPRNAEKLLFLHHNLDKVK